MWLFISLYLNNIFSKEFAFLRKILKLHFNIFLSKIDIIFSKEFAFLRKILKVHFILMVGVGEFYLWVYLAYNHGN